jgi:hypothetical protein
MRTSKNKIFFLLDFHSELNMGRDVGKVEKERIQRSNKPKLTFGIYMEVV